MVYWTIFITLCTYISTNLLSCSLQKEYLVGVSKTKNRGEGLANLWRHGVGLTIVCLLIKAASDSVTESNGAIWIFT